MNKMVWMISNNLILKCSFCTGCTNVGIFVASVQTWFSDDGSLHASLYMFHKSHFNIGVTYFNSLLNVTNIALYFHFECHCHLPLMLHTLILTSISLLISHFETCDSCFLDAADTLWSWFRSPRFNHGCCSLGCWCRLCSTVTLIKSIKIMKFSRY